MTTREAYKNLLSVRGVHKILGLSAGYVRVQRSRVKNNAYPIIDTMEKHLKASGGFKVVVKENWKRPLKIKNRLNK